MYEEQRNLTGYFVLKQKRLSKLIGVKLQNMLIYIVKFGIVELNV